MAGEPTTLMPFYRGWERYQWLLTRAVGPLGAGQLALSAAPSIWPVWRLAAHIASARVGWFHGTLGEGDVNVAWPRGWEADGMPPRDGAELTRALETSWALVRDCLERWTPDMLDDPFTTRHGQSVSRQWVIWHVIEHDLHHGGEIFLTLGMHGVPTPDLSSRAMDTDNRPPGA